jgi:L-alanine-DL-glutamate epimerase-like enolase superfamily enzyme
MAQHFIDHAGIGFLQIDTGRIGGVSVAYDAAQYARAHGVTYVNHTFTSHLALAASIAPYAGFEAETICEYPVEPKALALAITANHLSPSGDGMLRLLEAPGHGMQIDHEALRGYLVDTEIRVRGQVLYRTPELGE